MIGYDLNQFQATIIGQGVALNTPSTVPASNGQVPTWNTNGTFAGWASATSPAGSGTELQYRSGAATFGAVTGSSVSGANVTFGGTISCPGAGASSERFGDGSLAAGASSAAFGSNASSSGALSTAFGNFTLSSGLGSAAGGYASVASGNYSIAWGYRALASGYDSFAFGSDSIASAIHSMAFGQYALSAFSGSIALGYYVVPTAANQFVCGSDGSSINDIYFGKGVSNAAPTAYTIHGTNAASGDTSGGDIRLVGGTLSGSGLAGNVILGHDGSGARGRVIAASKFSFSAQVELTIATGAITITKAYHSVDTEADAASDDLDTISGGAEGDILILRANDSGRTVVVKNGTGNIFLDGSVDCSLDNARDKVVLIHNGTDWDEITRSNNAA